MDTSDLQLHSLASVPMSCTAYSGARFVQIPPFDPAVCDVPAAGPMAAEPGMADMPQDSAMIAPPDLAFQPIMSGGSLGEQNAADVEAPVPEAASEQGVADSSDAVSTGAAVATALAAAGLLLV